jgi:hypothetical protein
MDYYLNPRTQVLLLQILSIIFIFIIILMIAYHSIETTALKQEINDINIPPCPECPACPGCPACPVPEINMEELKENMDMKDKINLQCPECPSCPELSQSGQSYPTVEDIVSGIFPGRNMGLTRGGIYQTLDASGSYEILPEYDFYKPEDAFPKDSILSRAVGDIEKDKLVFDNSYDNMNIDTRMNNGLNGLGEDSLQASLNRADEESLQVSADDGMMDLIDDSINQDILLGEVVDDDDEDDEDIPIVQAQVITE